MLWYVIFCYIMSHHVTSHCIISFFKTENISSLHPFHSDCTSSSWMTHTSTVTFIVQNLSRFLLLMTLRLLFITLEMRLPVLSLTFISAVLCLSYKVLVIKIRLPRLCSFLFFPFCFGFQLLPPDPCFSKMPQILVLSRNSG